MKIASIFLLVIFFLSLANALAPTGALGQSLSPLSSRQEPDIPRISAELAYQKYRAGSIILVDAMPRYTFVNISILGSINLPNDGPEDLERIRKMKLPFPKNKEILTYCK